MTDRLLTREEVCMRWRISISTLYRQLRDGTVRVYPACRIGKRYRWRESDIDNDIKHAEFSAQRLTAVRRA